MPVAQELSATEPARRSGVTAERLRRLAESQVRERAGLARRRPMKLLGDGVMFHFPDPPEGVRCGLELYLAARGP